MTASVASGSFCNLINLLRGAQQAPLASKQSDGSPRGGTGERGVAGSLPEGGGERWAQSLNAGENLLHKGCASNDRWPSQLQRPGMVHWGGEHLQWGRREANPEQSKPGSQRLVMRKAVGLPGAAGGKAQQPLQAD